MSDENRLKKPEALHPRGHAPSAPIESLTDEEQDAFVDEWARGYANPSPEIKARYAEIGRQTREALDRDQREAAVLGRSPDGPLNASERTSRQAG
jgi:hypothetical protein